MGVIISIKNSFEVEFFFVLDETWQQIGADGSAATTLHQFDRQHMKYFWSMPIWQELIQSKTNQTLMILCLAKQGEKVTALGGDEFVLTISGQARHLVGFILGDINPEEHLFHLFKITTHSNVRRLQIALQGMQTLERWLKERGLDKIFLEVECQNQEAQAFYASQGYRNLHLSKSFYSDGQNAFIMLKDLTLSK